MSFTFKLDIDTKKLAEIQKDIKLLNKRHIRYGWIKNKMHPTALVPVANVAFWQEYGRPAQLSPPSPSIPSRPYFRQAINTIRYAYSTEIKNIFLSALEHKSTDSYLNFLAENIREKYGNSIASQRNIPLAPPTIALKGHKYQMFDSGVMINSFESKVYRQPLNATVNKKK